MKHIVGYGIALIPFTNHIVWCIGEAAHSGAGIALLLVGLFIPPVGWVHGMSLFLGYTWI